MSGVWHKLFTSLSFHFQIVKAVCECQKMSAKIDEVLSSGSQEDNVEEFLSKMISSGQRHTGTVKG